MKQHIYQKQACEGLRSVTGGQFGSDQLLRQIKSPHTFKSKLADSAYILNGKIIITRLQIVRFCWNFVCGWCGSTEATEN